MTEQSVRYIHTERTVHSTGTRVTLYDTQAPENVFDPEGGRWVTMCEDHGMLVNHDTLLQARRLLPYPDPWCEDCRHLV